jgi:cobalt-zinc-cadmium efflux system outer membrane protein
MISSSSHRAGRAASALRHALLFTSLALTGVAGIAQDNPANKASLAPLTLDTAVARAIDQHPRLRAAQRGLEASDGAVLQSKARPNPALSYSQEDTSRDKRTTTVQWTQMLEIGGKRDARMRAAARGRDVAEAELDAAKANLVADVRLAFFGLLVAQQREVLAGQTLDIARSAREAASKRVAAGKAAPLEANRASVAESSAELEQAQAQAAKRVARQQLQALIGEGGPVFGDAQGKLDALPTVPEIGVLQSRLEQSPSIQQARFTVEQSRATADLERAKRIPDPTVSLGMKRAQETGNQLVVGVSIPCLCSIPIEEISCKPSAWLTKLKSAC